MSRESREKVEKVLDFLGEIIAFFAVVLFALLIVNATFEFIENSKILKVLNIMWAYAGLALIAVVGLEATIKRNIVIRIIFYILLAICVIFLFFPDTYDNLIGIVK